MYTIIVTYIVYLYNTVNSLMFTGINVYAFETKPCLQGLIFAVSSGLGTGT